MSDLAPSNESTNRRALRLAFGVALVFGLTQFVSWPLAHVAPFMTAILLQDSGPLSLRRGGFIMKMAILSVIGGLFLALFLVHFPLILILVACALLFHLYIYILRSGEHLLAVVAGMIGVILMPYLVSIYPQVGAIGGLALLVNFAVAMLGAWIAWYTLPQSAPPPGGRGVELLGYNEAAAMAFTMALLMAPLLAGFLAFGWNSILVLIYSVIFASTYSGKGGFEMGLKMLIANAVYGGVGMLLVYELLVMVPTASFMIAIVALAVFVFSVKIFEGGSTSPYWASGLNGFLILLGGALLADEGHTLGRLADRVWQIMLATAYVSFSFAIVGMFRDMFTRQVISTAD
jgi:hypothetical protein